MHSASCIQTLLKWSVAASDAKKKVVKNSPMGGKKRWPFSTPFCISRECPIQTPDFIFYAPRLAQSSYTHAQSLTLTLTSFSPGWSHRSLSAELELQDSRSKIKLNGRQVTWSSPPIDIFKIVFLFKTSLQRCRYLQDPLQDPLQNGLEDIFKRLTPAK